MKKTRREYFKEIEVALREAGAPDEYVEFIDNEITKLDTKAENDKIKRNAKKAEGNALKDAVYAVIEAADGPIAPQEIADKLTEEFPEVTKNMVANRAGLLIKEGAIFKVKVNKLVAYTLDEPAEEVE